MTENELNKLCEEFNMIKIDFRNRLLYKNCVVGNYYFDAYEGNGEYRISFLVSSVCTYYYRTARKATIKRIEEIKKFIVSKKIEEINSEFENV